MSADLERWTRKQNRERSIARELRLVVTKLSARSSTSAEGNETRAEAGGAMPAIGSIENARGIMPPYSAAEK